MPLLHRVTTLAIAVVLLALAAFVVAAHRKRPPRSSRHTAVTGERSLEPTLAQIPDAPGVYMMLGAGERILYIGKAVSLRNRVRSYFQDSAAHHRARRRWSSASSTCARSSSPTRSRR